MAPRTSPRPLPLAPPPAQPGRSCPPLPAAHRRGRIAHSASRPPRRKPSRTAAPNPPLHTASSPCTGCATGRAPGAARAIETPSAACAPPLQRGLARPPLLPQRPPQRRRPPLHRPRRCALQPSARFSPPCRASVPPSRAPASR
eukprot:scaffold10545_cov131-Isochrysis_galbana.AAC.3